MLSSWRKTFVGFALFELPYRNYVFLKDEKIKAIYNWIPLNENTCRLEFMGCSNDSDDLAINFLDGELELLAQDRILLESAQYWFDQGNVPYEKNVRADGAPLAARQLIHKRLHTSTLPGNERHRITYRVYS